jgi:uncharacterized protein
MSMKNSIKRHPISWYYVISVVLVIVIIPLFVLTGAGADLDRALVATQIPFNTDLVTAARVVIAFPEALPGVVLAIAQVAAPDLALLIVALLGLGVQELVQVKRRFRLWGQDVPWRNALRVWTQCILVFCAMNVASAGLHRLMFPDTAFAWNINPFSLSFVIGLLIAMFLDAGAVFEENGWRGFALPRLQQRFGPWGASIVLGLMWSAWHMPVKFDLALNYGVANFVLLFAVLTIKFTLLTIIMTYFWNRVGQSTVIAIVMHGLSNDSVRLGGLVLAEDFVSQVLTELNLIIPMLIVTSILLMVIGRDLGLLRATPAAATLSQTSAVRP